MPCIFFTLLFYVFASKLDFSKVKIAFFSAGGKISEKFAAKAAKNCFVIDNSSHYRMDPEVPLIVPQVNSEDLNNIKKIL